MLLSSYYSQGADLPVGWLDAFQNQHSALPLAGVRGFVSFVKALPVNTGAGLLRHASVCGGGCTRLSIGSASPSQPASAPVRVSLLFLSVWAGHSVDSLCPCVTSMNFCLFLKMHVLGSVKDMNH